ncbi:AAEL000253-PA [Aedes aegypti]|uniref:AAEL000253-PA n=1 Tax=Aedes aegypti TaxID=7159 RepID=Q17PV3_AEDAE|nr:AAEL000253-PA [Aedes aegypti]
MISALNSTLLVLAVCGKRMFPEPRIVGGTKAAFGRWPWQISLRQWRTSTYLHKCGAALLNENWAITAAHCVDNVPPSDLLLRLGEYDLALEEEPYGYQERRVQIVASHPQFDPRTFEYDLALLRFYEPVVFQPNIIPVCVPDGDENFIGRTAFVTGWGRLYEGEFLVMIQYKKRKYKIYNPGNQYAFE